MSFGSNFGNLREIGLKIPAFKTQKYKSDYFIWTPRYCENDFHSAPTSEHFV